VVAPILLGGVSVGSAATGKRGIVLVAASVHFQNLLAVPRVKLLDATFEVQSLRVVLKRPVFAQQRADDAVEFSVFAQQMLAVELRNWHAPNPNHAAHPKNCRIPKINLEKGKN
jgi:hypothetical protein